MLPSRAPDFYAKSMRKVKRRDAPWSQTLKQKAYQLKEISVTQSNEKIRFDFAKSNHISEGITLSEIQLILLRN